MNIFQLILITLFFIGLYLILESLFVAICLNQGGRFCQFFRYLGSFTVGSLASYFSATQLYEGRLNLDGHLTVPFCIAIITLAASMWPSTFYRISKRYNRRIA